VFDGAEAARIGLLSGVVPLEKLDAEVDGILRHLTQGGPQAMAKIKDLIRAVAAGAVDDAMIGDTARRIAEIRVSPEGREGIASFLEKRKPGWNS
jgi:methylglutaconyl-CoA hydratase